MTHRPPGIHPVSSVGLPGQFGHHAHHAHPARPGHAATAGADRAGHRGQGRAGTRETPRLDWSLRDHQSLSATGHVRARAQDRGAEPVPVVPEDVVVRYRLRYAITQEFLVPTSTPGWSSARHQEVGAVIDWCLFADHAQPRIAIPPDFPGGITITDPVIPYWTLGFGSYLDDQGQPVTGYLIDRAVQSTITVWAHDEERLACTLRHAWSTRVQRRVERVPFWCLMQSEVLHRLQAPAIPREAILLDDEPTLTADGLDIRRPERGGAMARPAAFVAAAAAGAPPCAATGVGVVRASAAPEES